LTADLFGKTQLAEQDPTGMSHHEGREEHEEKRKLLNLIFVFFVVNRIS